MRNSAKSSLSNDIATDGRTCKHRWYVYSMLHEQHIHSRAHSRRPSQRIKARMNDIELKKLERKRVIAFQQKDKRETKTFLIHSLSESNSLRTEVHMKRGEVERGAKNQREGERERGSN